MKRSILTAVLALLATAPVTGRAPLTKVGEPAPPFSVADDRGTTRSLADFKGKVVVLEWIDQSCAYVQKHYKTRDMQTLQKDWTARGVVWLTVNSSGPGTPGAVTPAESQDFASKSATKATANLLDSNGDLGRLYDAKTTPQMFVIDKAGTLIYSGAIDDQPTTDLASAAEAKNYVGDALTELFAGKAVTTPSSTPYGCSIRYK